MKSRITIELDFENGNMPIIQILQQDSDDVRDKLVKSFTQHLGGSSWCQIKWKPENYIGAPNETQRIHITPINFADLKEQAEIMLEQYRLSRMPQTP